MCQSGASPLGCRCDGVHHLYDAVQGRVSADCHVGAAEVIIDGAHHANNVEMCGALSLVIGDLTWRGNMDKVTWSHSGTSTPIHQ